MRIRGEKENKGGPTEEKETEKEESETKYRKLGSAYYGECESSRNSGPEGASKTILSNLLFPR